MSINYSNTLRRELNRLVIPNVRTFMKIDTFQNKDETVYVILKYSRHYLKHL